MLSVTHPVVAVVGAGFIGPVHVEALRRLGLSVKGILGSSPQKSSEAALRLGLPVGYSSYEALLADPEITAVHLASPNRLHHYQVIAALKAGKHVVCEKPLGLNTRETASLVAAAAAHPHLICAVNYNVRFYPCALHARALVREGKLGSIFHIHGSYLQDWLLYPTDFNWRVLSEDGGELRAVSDIGTHWTDLICFISGLEIEAVLADLRTVHPTRQKPAEGKSDTFTSSGIQTLTTTSVPITTEDYGSILLRFRGGAKGVLTVSQVSAGRKNALSFEIAGSQGAIAWNSENPEKLWHGLRSTPSELIMRDPSQIDSSVARFSDYPAGHAEGFPDTFKQLYRAIYADVRAGARSSTPLYATFADAHREVALCEAVSTSAKSGSWTPVA